VLWGMKNRFSLRVGLSVVAMLAVLCGVAPAQVSWGDLHATADGRLQTIYTGEWGNLPGSDNHSLGFSGIGTIAGDYYNPNFLSFTAQPYYNRAQDNSDLQSITNASGYNGTVNLFRGSHFPGFVGVQQTWNQSGNFGVPGVAGLTTVNNSHGFNVGWSALLPGLPTLSVGFADGGGNSYLLGSSATTDSSSRNFNVSSSYVLGNYAMNGGFIHLINNVDVNGLENGETDTANLSSNQYHFNLQGPIPYRHSSMSVGFTRTSYDDEGSQSAPDLSTTNKTNGTTDTVTGNVSLMFPKAPVNVTTIYTDNLLGSLEQQLVSSGEVPLNSLNSPASRSLSVQASTYVNVLPRLLVGGYVVRTEEFYDGENYGLTQVGLTANYSFLQRLKGLTFYGGVTDAATQEGNSQVGFIGNVNYSRAFDGWRVEGYFRYNQNTQTLLAQYTISTLNWGGSLKREIKPGLTWQSVVNFTRGGFEQVSGNGNHSESFTTMLIGPKAAISGIYSNSSGVAILTSAGLVTTTLPTQVLGPESVLYTGKSYGANVSLYPIRHLLVSGAWSKAFANTSSPTLLSNSGNTNYYTMLGYEFRKLWFTAGATKFTQSISNSGTLPSMLTSYYFGIQRWFKGF
jgi:hypothetical protein